MHCVNKRDRRNYLLDEAGAHDIKRQRGVRDHPECRRVEFYEVAFRDRSHPEFPQKRLGILSISRAGHLRRLVSHVK